MRIHMSACKYEKRFEAFQKNQTESIVATEASFLQPICGTRTLNANFNLWFALNVSFRTLNWLLWPLRDLILSSKRNYFKDNQYNNDYNNNIWVRTDDWRIFKNATMKQLQLKPNS